MPKQNFNMHYHILSSEVTLGLWKLPSKLMLDA